jgi:mannose-6-phosphate isomerase-like protein (cupin superfamily)
MGSLLTFLAESKDTRRAFTLIEGFLKPGNEPPLHVHEREDELFYVLEGEMDVYVGNEVFKVGAGECLFLPKLKPHTFIVS